MEEKRERMDENNVEGKSHDFSSSDENKSFTKIDREEEWPEPPDEEEK